MTARMAPPAAPSPDLQRMLDAAAKHKLTPTELWDQRVSLAFGQLPAESTMTRADIERIATLMHGPRPEPTRGRSAGRSLGDADGDGGVDG